MWVDAIRPLAWIAEHRGKNPAVRDRHDHLHLHVRLYPATPGCEFRAALIGGVTAGVVWALVGKVFTAFIVYSSRVVAIYTGFAIVLTTLIWVYLSWLILLIGAQLAFYCNFRSTCAMAKNPLS